MFIQIVDNFKIESVIHNYHNMLKFRTIYDVMFEKSEKNALRIYFLLYYTVIIIV